MQTTTRASKQIKPGVNVGFISLMMIFMILCLAVFVALSLTVASADNRLTSRTGQTVQDYFGALNRVQEILFEHDAMLLDAVLANAPTEDLGATLQAQSNMKPGEEISFDGATGVLTLCIPAGERVFLNAGVIIADPGETPRVKIYCISASPAPENFNRPAGNVFRPHTHDH